MRRQPQRLLVAHDTNCIFIQPMIETRLSNEPRKPARPKHRVRVLRVRIKNKHAEALDEMARAVNLCWNYCNELSLKILEREQRFVKASELQRYMAGASKEGLPVGSAVFQQVAEEFVTRRAQHRKRRLAWRVSRGSRRSLGWIPFKARSLTYRAGQIQFQGQMLGIWDSWGMGEVELGAGCISQDARGRWYLNVTVKLPALPAKPPTLSAPVGIDLGLKDLAALSDGRKIEAQRFYRDLEPALATAQRAGKRARVRAIHAKIANRRKDFLHQFSSQLVREHGCIVVGDVNAQALAQGPHAKSVLDAGWSTLRTMLKYKSDDAAVWFLETSESHTTRTCSHCGERTGPSGVEGLAVRRWACAHCGWAHDRDVNAARNILKRGLLQLEQQFSSALEAKACERAVNEAGAKASAGAGHGPLAAGIPRL
ncbi:RNA-guided endonuclease InsQ/TnpB family protein [Piscinibacterium candidicorallinum]